MLSMLADCSIAYTARRKISLLCCPTLYCCSGKTKCITYTESVFAALSIQSGKRMRHIVVCGLPSSTIFLNIFSHTRRFWTKAFELEMCVVTFSTNFV
jgi:hypothetical protein